MNQYFDLIITPLFLFLFMFKIIFALILTIATVRQLVITKTFSIKALLKTLLCALGYVLMIKPLWRNWFGRNSQPKARYSNTSGEF